MPWSHTDGEARMPTLTKRDSNLPDTLCDSMTFDPGETPAQGPLIDAHFVFHNDTVTLATPLAETPLTSGPLGHPAQQGQQLAAIADSEAERVGPAAETLKLCLSLRVVDHRGSPAWEIIYTHIIYTHITYTHIIYTHIIYTYILYI